MTSRPIWTSAEIDIRKLRDYCPDLSHKEGGHKARVFRAALGLTGADAEWFRGEILNRLPFFESVPVGTDDYGARYNVDLPIARLGRQDVIRTSWIVRPEDGKPHLVSCRVL